MSKRSPDNSAPSMASMEVIIEVYIRHLHAADPKFEEKVVREMEGNFSHDMQPENDHEWSVYDELALAFPLFGDPRSYNEKACIPSSYTARIAAGSAKRD